MPGWEPINNEEEFELPPIDPAGAYELWPDNMDPFCVYRDLRTQWRLDSNGLRYALDYGAVLAVLRETVADKERRVALFEDLRCMEFAAVPVHEKLLREAHEEMQREAEFRSMQQEWKHR